MKGHDLHHFVQHRPLDAHEHIVARRSYAYGVDLRRSTGLTDSIVGSSLVRAVDRAWPALAEHLLDEVVLDGLAAPPSILHELASFITLLRAPLPSLRVLRPEQRGRWPLVTVLGATRGNAQWLILDVEALRALDPDRRAFLLGAGLGHVHCGHALFFTVHLLVARGQGGARIGALGRISRPWTKVMMFSADRAGLLTCGSLDAAVSTIENPPMAVGHDPVPRWLPPTPSAAMRVQAIQEFARSAVVADVNAELASRRGPDDPLALIKPRVRMTTKAIDDDGVEPSSDEDTPSSDEDTPSSDEDTPSSDEDTPRDVLAEAWSLARVDARLTERLALL